MKRAILGTLVGVGLLVVAVAAGQQRAEVTASNAKPGTSAATGDLIVVPTLLGDQAQVLTIVDAKQRVVGVYHVELATGKIALKSVRKIEWDLQINDMNTENPLPQQVRSMVEQK